MKCEYCGSENQNKPKCLQCGAEVKGDSARLWKSDPFFYNGYVCYFIHNGIMKRETEIQFWLGRELIERICVDDILLESKFPEGQDVMPFFWELFLLAHGEQDVIYWRDKNNIYPAQFTITRLDNHELERKKTLSMRDLAFESVRR